MISQDRYHHGLHAKYQRLEGIGGGDKHAWFEEYVLLFSYVMTCYVAEQRSIINTSPRLYLVLLPKLLTC